MELLEPEAGQLPGAPEEDPEEQPVQPRGTLVVFKHGCSWRLGASSPLKPLQHQAVGRRARNGNDGQGLDSPLVVVAAKALTGAGAGTQALEAISGQLPIHGLRCQVLGGFPALGAQVGVGLLDRLLRHQGYLLGRADPRRPAEQSQQDEHATGEGSGCHGSGRIEGLLRLEQRSGRNGTALFAHLIVQCLELGVDGAQLLTNGFGVLQLAQGQEHRFDLILAVDQDAAFAGARFVAHGRVFAGTPSKRACLSKSVANIAVLRVEGRFSCSRLASAVWKCLVQPSSSLS